MTFSFFSYSISQNENNGKTTSKMTPFSQNFRIFRSFLKSKIIYSAQKDHTVINALFALKE